MSKRAAIYARVSTDDQRGNFSVPTQLSECLKRVEEKDYALVGNQYIDPETGREIEPGNGAVRAFVDDYTSGELSRPALDMVFTYLEAFGFDVLIVYSLDRLARDPYIRQTLEMDLGKHGAKVDYVIGGYDETPEGEVRKDLDATFAKWENAKRVERSNRGKLGKAKSGLFVAGRAPFGYRIDRNMPGGLSIDEEQAWVIRRVFELYTEQGKSIRDIGEILTSEGISAPLGGPKWGTSTIRGILSNAAYNGQIHYNKNKRLGKRLIKRDKKQWVEIRVTPIVDRDAFSEAQKRLNSSRMTRRRPSKRFYLLSGMVYCAECGRSYIGQAAPAGKNRRITDALSYRHRVRDGHCLNRYVSARILDGTVWDEIVKVLLDPANLRRGYEESLLEQQATDTKNRAELETLYRKAEKIEQKKRNLNEAYIDPDIGLAKSEYVEERDRLEQKLKEISDSAATLEEELHNVPTRADLPKLEEFSEAIRSSFGDATALTPSQKRSILELLNIRVLIGRDGKIQLTGWIDPTSVSLSGTTCSCLEQQPYAFRLPVR